MTEQFETVYNFIEQRVSIVDLHLLLCILLLLTPTISTELVFLLI